MGSKQSKKKSLVISILLQIQYFVKLYFKLLSNCQKSFHYGLILDCLITLHMSKTESCHFIIANSHYILLNLGHFSYLLIALLVQINLLYHAN